MVQRSAMAPRSTSNHGDTSLSLTFQLVVIMFIFCFKVAIIKYLLSCAAHITYFNTTIGSVTFMSVCWSVGWSVVSVCHNFQEEWKVTLPCSYRNICYIYTNQKKFLYRIFSLLRLFFVLTFADLHNNINKNYAKKTT